MTTSAPMQHLFWRFWWASPALPFTYPGLYVWAFGGNRRIIPLYSSFVAPSSPSFDSGSMTIEGLPEGLRAYGPGGTIHGTRELDVEVHDGKVVGVWFRCQTVAFNQVDVDAGRAHDMAVASSLAPKLLGLILEDSRKRRT